MSQQQDDVVIVGGGIVGAATAFYLSRHGISTTIIERDSVAAHASGYAFGGLHPRLSQDSTPSMQVFVHESFEKHIELHEYITSQTDRVSTWRPRTSIELVLPSNSPGVAEYQSTSTSEGELWLDQQELLDKEPMISDRVLGGRLVSSSAEVDSHTLVKNLVELAGAKVVEGEVAEPVIEGDQVQAVRLTDGSVIKSTAIVFAMGPWTNQVFEWFGFYSEPITPLKGQILRLRVNDAKLAHSLSVGGNYLSLKPDGLVWVGTTEEHAGIDESPTEEGRARIFGIFLTMLPKCKDFQVLKQTACVRPMSKDNSLILGALTQYPNVFIGSGGGRKGILYGPLMGYELANLIVQGETKGNREEFSPERFH